MIRFIPFVLRSIENNEILCIQRTVHLLVPKIKYIFQCLYNDKDSKILKTN